jgi:hypothetical protein
VVNSTFASRAKLTKNIYLESSGLSMCRISQRRSIAKAILIVQISVCAWNGCFSSISTAR